MAECVSDDCLHRSADRHVHGQGQVLPTAACCSHRHWKQKSQEKPSEAQCCWGLWVEGVEGGAVPAPSSSLRVSSAALTLMSVTTTRAPSRAKTWQTALPIPLPPPVYQTESWSCKQYLSKSTLISWWIVGFLLKIWFYMLGQHKELFVIYLIDECFQLEPG